MLAVLTNENMAVTAQDRRRTSNATIKIGLGIQLYREGGSNFRRIMRHHKNGGAQAMKTQDHK